MECYKIVSSKLADGELERALNILASQGFTFLAIRPDGSIIMSQTLKKDQESVPHYPCRPVKY